MNIFITKKSQSLFFKSISNELKRQNKIYFYHSKKTELLITLLLFCISCVKKIKIVNFMANYSINLKGIDTTTVHVDCGHLHSEHG